MIPRFIRWLRNSDELDELRRRIERAEKELADLRKAVDAVEDREEQDDVFL